MTNLSRLELSCGVGTVLVSTALSLLVFNFDWNASRTVNEQFSVVRELSLVLVLFMGPGMLVALGSYAHAGKGKWWGKVLLALGCLTVVGSFGFLLAILPYVTLSPWTLLNFSFVLLAILTLVFSFIAGKNKQVRGVLPRMN